MTATKRSPVGLVGRGMQRLKDGRINNQGVVIADLKNGHYLVQMFSWLTGFPTTQLVYSIEDFAKHEEFQFFENLEDSNDWIEHHPNAPWEPKEDLEE